MTVKAILSTKGSDVTTTEPTATLESGIRVLAERGIGALVVLGADHRVIGILSERDVVRVSRITYFDVLASTPIDGQRA
jgi:CBS domain-containing protein